MATNHRTNERLKVRYGQCLNESCEKHKEKYIEIPARKDFVCPDCGKPLRETLPPKRGFQGMQWIFWVCIIVLLAVFFVGWGLNWWWGGNDTEIIDDSNLNPGLEQVVAEEPPQVDSPLIVEEPEIIEEPITEPAPQPEPGPQTPPPANVTVLGGAATLVGTGANQMLKFNRAYTLDLGTTDGAVLQIKPGDVIERPNIYHDVLRSGNYKSVNGEEQFLKGLNVKLK